MVEIDDLSRDEAIALLKRIRNLLSGEDAGDIVLSIMDIFGVDSRNPFAEDDDAPFHLGHIDLAETAPEIQAMVREIADEIYGKRPL